MSLNSFAGLSSPYPSAPGPAGEAPPPYTSYPAGPVDPGGSFVWHSSPSVTSVTATPPVGYTPVGMKLCYMDFVPRLVRKRLVGKNEYENFRYNTNGIIFILNKNNNNLNLGTGRALTIKYLVSFVIIF